MEILRYTEVRIRPFERNKEDNNQNNRKNLQVIERKKM